jgi:type I restriction enzyme S subunit
MSEWKEYKFSDFVTINPTVKLPSNELISFVEMKDLDSGKRFCYPSSERINGSGAKFEEYDTLFARITPCLENGKICQVKRLKNKKGLGSTEFLVFRGKENISDTNFVFYLSRWDEVRSHAEINLDGTSGRQRVPKECFEDLLLNLPTDIKEQRAIASVLSSLDDKIDLLHRQNATLEKMAETLFRQWFVEEAKEEWEEKTTDDVVSIKGGTTPSTKETSYWDGNIYWSTPKDLSNQQSVYLFETERKITEKGLLQISSGLLPQGTVLLSSRAPIGYLAITEIPTAINQGYIAIVCNKTVSNYFTYLWCKYNMEEIENSGNGSVFQEISKGVFKEFGILVPPKEYLSDFDNTIEPIFKKMKTNQSQIRTLTQLRDTLLPKLMSGEIKVKN